MVQISKGKLMSCRCVSITLSDFESLFRGLILQNSPARVYFVLSDMAALSGRHLSIPQLQSLHVL